MSDALGYYEIKLKGIKVKQVLKVEIKKELNNHDRAYVYALLSEEDKEVCVEQANKKTLIEIINEGKGPSTLFCGLVTEIQVKMVQGVYYLQLYSISTSYELDIKRKKRTFQDENETYEAMVKKIVGEYPGADVSDVVTKGKKKGKFILQYNETDWEFLKRMASHFNSVLISDGLSKKAKFWFGTDVASNGESDLGAHNYTISKKVSNFRDMQENHIKSIKDSDFISYDLQLDVVLYVKECFIHIENGILKGEYLLTNKNGLQGPEILNENFIGLNLEGKVIERIEDRAKIHFDIDKTQDKATAFEFPVLTPYTTEGETGIYMMPEEKDHVKVLFTTAREEEGVVSNSVRRYDKGGDKIMDPDIKFIRTKFGKEIMFTDKEILISAKDQEIFIRITEENGIEMYSKKDIKMQADGNIELNSKKKISITASQEIGLKCKASSIKMNGVTDIKGTQVKTN